MARSFAIVFGAVYLLVGLLGLVLPSPLLGIFGVNLLHDIVHLAVGGLWLAAAFAGVFRADSPRRASQLIGIVYLVVAVLGFALPDLMYRLLVIDMPDNFLHLGTAVLALYFGFAAPRTAAVPA